jgi:hypothetical protein
MCANLQPTVKLVGGMTQTAVSRSKSAAKCDGKNVREGGVSPLKDFEKSAEDADNRIESLKVAEEGKGCM